MESFEPAQAATAGSLTLGLSVTRARLSRDMYLHATALVIGLEHESADQSDDDGLDNLANFDFEWRVEIERERLRPRYREGFGRVLLNLRWQPDLRGPKGGGADGPA